jgi:hypothetical protein
MADEHDQDRRTGLDEDRTDTPYLLGRIIALNEEIIRLGSGERAGHTYKETHWPSAVQGRARGAIVQGERLASRAMPKLRSRCPERGTHLEAAKSVLFTWIDQVPDHIGADSLQLNLGYQHQRAALPARATRSARMPDRRD